MARLLVSRKAHADLERILSHLAHAAGLTTARKYQDLFERLYRRVADHPESGSPRAALGEGVRIAIVSPFVLIYRYRESEEFAIVLRIVHGRRKIAGSDLPRE